MFHQYDGLYDMNFLGISSILYLISVIFILVIIFYIIYRLYIKEELKKNHEQRSVVLNLITWVIFFLIICIANILKIISLILIITKL